MDNIFTPHSTRAASASKADTRFPLETILKTTAWSEESTFRKFYNKPIHKTGEFGLSIVDNVNKVCALVFVTTFELRNLSVKNIMHLTKRFSFMIILSMVHKQGFTHLT